MSSRSAAIPTGSGAPNATRARDRAPSVRASGSPAASIASRSSAWARSRCGCAGHRPHARRRGASAGAVRRSDGRRRHARIGRARTRLVVCPTMDEPDGQPQTVSRPDGRDAGCGALDAAAWVAALPPPPFVEPSSYPTSPRFAPLSPRVAVLIAAAIVVGVLLWMARDAVRPFVVGLLLVYLLDPPVRWLARRGIRRTIAILLVYVVAIVVIVEFLNLTLTPLVNELVRFAAGPAGPRRRSSRPRSSACRRSTPGSSCPTPSGNGSTR